MINKRLYLGITTGFSALGGLLFGYDTGVISGAILFIRHEFQLSYFQVETVVSAVLFGAVGGAACAGIFSDQFGRRKLLLFTALLFILASLGSALSTNANWLILSRILVGIAIGISSMTTPLYIAEIAPASSRGRLVSLNQLAITIGILTSYIVDYTLASSESWRWMVGIGIIPAAIFGLGMIFLPESPRWLFKNGYEDQALQVLTFIHGQKVAHQEMQEIQESIKIPKMTFTQAMTPWLKKALTIGIGLAIFQQLTGINTVIYYAPMIFEFAHFTIASHAILATGVIGVVNVLATVVALWLVDRVGRRSLLLVGLWGMIISLGILGASFYFPHFSDYLGWLTLSTLILYVISFAVSLGPIFWLLIAEIYPLSVRGKAMSIATIANWLANLVVALTFLTFIDLLGPGATFWFYGIVGIAAWIFSYYLVPETKKMTLEEIEAKWNH
jgi:MFS transporter, SP family, galactose:H+ symporter